MAKSADAFRTISEVAEWLDTPAHVLRFWESRFSQVKPVKRAGGRRYYRPNDMLLLGGIKKLLHEDGMTIKGVQKLLRVDGVKKIAALSQPIDVEAADIVDITDYSETPKAEIPVDPPAPEIIEREAISIVGSKDTQEEPSPEIESETVAEPEVQQQPEPQPEPEPEVDTQPEPDVEPQPAIEVEPQSEPEAEPQPAPESTPESDPKTAQLSSIFNRLTALHTRMKSDIDPK